MSKAFHVLDAVKNIEDLGWKLVIGEVTDPCEDSYRFEYKLTEDNHFCFDMDGTVKDAVCCIEYNYETGDYDMVAFGSPVKPAEINAEAMYMPREHVAAFSDFMRLLAQRDIEEL